MPLPRTVVFFDTEFTSWEGAWQANWSLPGQYREIVQIGAARFDVDTFKIIDEFVVTAKPVKNPVLSDYFINLTGITNEEVTETGLDYLEAMRRFRAYVGADPAASYGGDSEVLNENFGFHNVDDRFDDLNIAPWFHEHGAAYGLVPSLNSGALAKTLGVSIDSIQEHNALHDVRSIAGAYTFLRHKGVADFFTW